MKRTNENIVTSFFFYMWNAWGEEECKAVFGSLYKHFWEKWNSVASKSTYGAAERFYAELSENNRELLVNRAVALYNGKATRKEKDDSEILVCNECGSMTVEVQAWINANTDEFISDIDNGDRYCDDCDTCVLFCSKGEFEERMNLWWDNMEFKYLEQVTGLKVTDFSTEDGSQDFVDACNQWWESKSYDEKREIYNTKSYSVFIDGEEVNDYYLSHEEATRLAGDYCEDGYTNVEIVKL